MQHVRGRYVIFADADGASRFEDLGILEAGLKKIERDSLAVAVGSRAHMVHSAAVVQVCLLVICSAYDSVPSFAISPCTHFIRFCISLAFGLLKIPNADSSYSLVERVR
jgi:hypothetical protein